MSNIIKALVAELKLGLQKLYGPRLRGVYLYGSYAREEEDIGSDIDVLVVLDVVDHYTGEIRYTGELVSELSLKHGITISTVFLSRSEWSNGQSPFLWNIRKDAIAA